MITQIQIFKAPVKTKLRPFSIDRQAGRQTDAECRPAKQLKLFRSAT